MLVSVLRFGRSGSVSFSVTVEHRSVANRRTHLQVAIFFVIVCILGFVVSELVCGQSASGYGRARLLGKHGARVSPYYVD